MRVEYIDIWYDHNVTSWVVQRKDGEENQVGRADYVYTKKEAKDYADSYREEHPEAKVRIYKRSGELGRIL